MLCSNRQSGPDFQMIRKVIIIHKWLLFVAPNIGHEILYLWWFCGFGKAWIIQTNIPFRNDVCSAGCTLYKLYKSKQYNVCCKKSYVHICGGHQFEWVKTKIHRDFPSHIVHEFIDTTAMSNERETISKEQSFYTSLSKWRPMIWNNAHAPTKHTSTQLFPFQFIITMCMR